VNVETSSPPPAAPPSSKTPESVRRLKELYRYRGLIRNLVVSELKVRYKNSALGFVWSLLNPLGMMVVFTVVFGVLWPNNQIEKYPLFLLTGLLPWNYFAASINSSTNSIVANSNLIKKVYFPREVLPISSVLAQLINFLLAFVVLFTVLLIFRSNLSPWLPLLPAIILIQTVFTIGVALILSTLNVFYRDTTIILEVVILAWFFLTPIFYSVEMLPASYDLMGLTLDARRIYYIANPMASLVNMYRDMLYYGYRTDPDFFLRTTLTALVVFGLGFSFFMRYSGRFGEEV
jgi:lipopolysaccharide transport system permease protein